MADRDGNARKEKNSAIGKVVVMGIILAIVLLTTSYLLRPLVSESYVRYLHVAEVAVVGYIVIDIVGNVAKRLSMSYSPLVAQSIKSLIRILGAIIVIAFMISYLSQDPVVAASLSTISGIVVGFAASNLIGNALAGIYLAIARPFRIGDKIKVFGETGIVIDIGILYTRLVIDDGRGDHMLASNSSMVNSNIILKKGHSKGTTD